MLDGNLFCLENTTKTHEKLRACKKDIIISGGENISTIEVEQTIVKYPAVLECAVIAVPDEVWGERPKAFVTLKPGQAATEQEIITFCRERLAHFKCPALCHSFEQKLAQSLICLVWRFFRKKMTAWKRFTMHIISSFTPHLQDIVPAPNNSSLTPEGQHGTGHLLIQVGFIVLQIN